MHSLHSMPSSSQSSSSESDDFVKRGNVNSKSKGLGIAVARLRSAKVPAGKIPVAKCEIKKRAPAQAPHKARAIVEFWRQQNFKQDNAVIRNFWTCIAGYKIEMLDDIWSNVDDPMDIDEPDS